MKFGKINEEKKNRHYFDIVLEELNTRFYYEMNSNTRIKEINRDLEFNPKINEQILLYYTFRLIAKKKVV